MAKTKSPFGIPLQPLPKPLRVPTAIDLLNANPALPKQIKEGLRPPSATRPPVLPTGPKRYRLERRPEIQAGPGEPPPGFVTPTTSRDEWFVYWALTKIKGPEGPANGWAYQDAQAGGRSLPGGSILDFLIYDRQPRLAIRVQTERFHITFGSRQHAHDHEQMMALYRLGFEVVNIFSQDFIHDKSGKAVLKVVREALSGVRQADPIAFGMALARV